MTSFRRSATLNDALDENLAEHEVAAEQVEVVMLAYVDGLSHSEIAGKLSLPMGTVKSRMRLAYQKIRTAFEDRQ